MLRVLELRTKREDGTQSFPMSHTQFPLSFLNILLRCNSHTVQFAHS